MVSLAVTVLLLLASDVPTALGVLLALPTVRSVSLTKRVSMD